MKNKQQNQTKKNNEKAEKRVYTTPHVIPLGDIRDVTMGGSPGFGDSGAGVPEDPF
ncbi:MAG: hypothetical protein AB8B80_01935 [Marinicellaceae bacterium]